MASVGGERPSRAPAADAPRVQLQLPARADSPSVARQELGRLEPELDRKLTARLRVIVSELVANCVNDQGDGVVLVELTAGDEVVRGEVAELDADGEPRPADSAPFRRGALARAVVTSLADRLGALGDRRGIWFEIDR